MSSFTVSERFLDIDEASSFLNVKKSWLYQNHRHLGIPSYNIGRKLLFKLHELDGWVRETQK